MFIFTDSPPSTINDDLITKIVNRARQINVKVNFEIIIDFK